VAVAGLRSGTAAASASAPAAALPVTAVPIAIAAVPVALATIAVPALAPRLPLPRRPLAPTIAVTLGRLQERLARQLHPVLVVDRDHLYLHLVPDLDHVLDPADVPDVEFGDVAQAVAARADFDARPELLDRDHLPLVHRPDLHLHRQGLDLSAGILDSCAFQPGDRHRPVVLDIDLRPGPLLDRPDRLAARPDQEPDLLRVDLQLDDPRGIRADLPARGREGGEHRLEDLQPGLAGLLQCPADDLCTDPVELDIELDAGDPLLGAGDLEVHVAVVVLVALDVGDEDVLVLLGHQPDRDAGDRSLDRHACI